MSYVTQNTVWPDSARLSQKTKDLISLFYSLADHPGPDAGPRLANEVFMEDARMVAGTGEFKGSEAIRRSRDNAWTTVAKRHHTVQQVYVNDKSGCDLMILGKLEMVSKDGQAKETEFAARLLVSAESQAAEKPKLELMEVFAKV